MASENFRFIFLREQNAPLAEVSLTSTEGFSRGCKRVVYANDGTADQTVTLGGSSAITMKAGDVLDVNLVINTVQVGGSGAFRFWAFV